MNDILGQGCKFPFQFSKLGQTTAEVDAWQGTRQTDTVQATRIQDVKQWEDMRDKLDAKVRALLNEGLEVELI